MSYMKVAPLMLLALPTAVFAVPCEEGVTCPANVKADSLIQIREGAKASVSVSEGAEGWDDFSSYLNYTLSGQNGTSIMLRHNGFEGIASNFEGTMLSCEEACLAQTDPKCLAFTFASPVWTIKTHRWCKLHTQMGPMFHRKEFFLGFPNSRRVDLSSNSDFFLERIGDVGAQKNCLAQVGSIFETVACNFGDANQKWHKNEDGIFVNSASGQCIANKDNQIEAVAVPENPLTTCAKSYYLTNSDNQGKLFLEKLDSYEVPDAADEASWDGTMRQFWEPGSIPEVSSKLTIKRGASPRSYAQVPPP